MRVVINAVSARLGGAATVTEGLARECAKLTEHDFTWFISPESRQMFPDPPKHFQIVTTNSGSFSAPRRLYWDQVTFRGLIKRIKPDLVYSTGNFAVLLCPAKQLLLISQPVPFSELWLREIYPKKSVLARTSTLMRRSLICVSARRADIVMAPTQAMLNDLERYIKLDRRKTLVNPFGLDLPECLADPSDDNERPSVFRNPDEVRLCYVSLYAEHKNLSTLLKAMPLVNGSGARRFVVKTTVNPGWDGAFWTCTYKDDLALAKRPDVQKWVEFVGPLGLREVSTLYRESDIMIFPSLAESYGYPMPEAMSYGLPIVAADTPVNREICGDAAVYFSPMDPDDLARRIRHVAEDVVLRKNLRQNGLQRARVMFRWDTHVKKILESAEGRHLQSPASNRGQNMSAQHIRLT